MRRVMAIILFLFFIGLAELGREMLETQTPVDDGEREAEEQIIGTKEAHRYMNKAALLGAPTVSKEELILNRGREKRYYNR